MPRVTADTNIYISGLYFQGKPFDFLELARYGAIELAISEPILVEIRRVLTDKFHWSQEEIAVVERRICKRPVLAVTLSKPRLIVHDVVVGHQSFRR